MAPEGSEIVIAAGRACSWAPTERLLTIYTVRNGRWTLTYGHAVRGLEGCDPADAHQLDYGSLRHVTREYSECQSGMRSWSPEAQARHSAKLDEIAAKVG